MLLRGAPWLLGGLLLGGLGGCHDRVFVPPSDGGADWVGYDAGSAYDGTRVPLSLDITVTGCPMFDLTNRQCIGAAPLAVGFSPVSSGTLDQLLWDFGDGTAQSFDRAPVHTYTLPGTYDVTVAGDGPSGTVSRTRRALVAVLSATLSQACDVDAQCASGLNCLCGAAAICPPAFTHGLCSRACPDGVCPAGAVCADLSPPAPDAPDAGDTPGAWQRASCLQACAADSDCSDGLLCRDLPMRGASGQASSWVKGCFVPYPLDLGSPCRQADGSLNGAACTSGLCGDFGAAGLCTAACGTGQSCPPTSACATLGDGRTLCLRACQSAGDCSNDPLLDCQPSGAAGALGFTIAGATSSTPAATYCAPRACHADSDCQPAGVCGGGPDAGHCATP